FGQSYTPLMLSQNAYDTICHEHLEYYSLKQVKWMLDQCGLKIIDVQINDVNGGSFAVTAARAESTLEPATETIDRIAREESAAGMDTLAPYERFAERVFEHRKNLVDLLDGLSQNGSRVLGYGASTKGNVILQFCGLTPAQLPCIAEVNADKFGCFTPGTNIPIVSEADAHALDPEYFLV